MNQIKRIVMFGLLISSLCVGGISAFAAGCNHPSLKAMGGSNVNSWNSTHTYQGKVCSVYNWVERIDYQCTSCGTMVTSVDIQHENHSLCGVNK